MDEHQHAEDEQECEQTDHLENCNTGALPLEPQPFEVLEELELRLVAGQALAVLIDVPTVDVAKKPRGHRQVGNLCRIETHDASARSHEEHW